ncbi:VanY-A/VanY-F/VanY-M family D-Ala-D-Ala carboxypeptidase [Gracilibacillus salinarum]|uniref:VanY-A/VanY-F/VanY-M family D-Ala-D-Ala carboxypeptidase n=1 Tax=Gracilibacillus salinarum TaxID=2932255 RepID=A0ABY4GH07_9BACI|nr:VanY-A/VanY-F/VanY-M family D-Ala-D-Ala carboxypeptidase [Gracilibacillus salinarum]UOQ83524.1 VanY-A/VanY-F/VanY-M family D-Ala-D-Ala carboxypeptidase [Gracilibacillus salinarum]
MKKWGCLILLLVSLCVVFVNRGSFESREDIPSVEVQGYDQEEDRSAYDNIQKLKVIEEQIYQGNLLLVNSEYPVRQEGVKSDVVNLFKHNELVKGYGLLYNDTYLSEDIAREFSELVAAADKGGVDNFWITSGYRDFDEQRQLYQEKGSGTALPAGYSEHNLGLSLDVGNTQTPMAKAPEGEWIEENAWEYGFILRYPEDKTDITGIQYEPWHIRYVGLPHSAIMKEKNFVLEEYLDYLKEEKVISVSVKGKKYQISYYAVHKNMTIQVPSKLHYEISGNNMDGVIVTVFL